MLQQSIEPRFALQGLCGIDVTRLTGSYPDLCQRTETEHLNDASPFRC